MPGVDGFEVLSRLRRMPGGHTVPVVVLTGHTERESKLRGFKLGAVDYLTKPVDRAELLARITGHMHRGRLVRSLERRLEHYRSRVPECRDEPQDTGNGPGECADLPAGKVTQLERAVDILRQRLADPPSLETLAERVGMSQPTLSKYFQVLYGATVYGYLRELRLEHARRALLEEPGKLVKTIALEVGYRHPNDLIRNFKKRYGMTPSQMRELAPPRSD